MTDGQRTEDGKSLYDRLLEPLRRCDEGVSKPQVQLGGRMVSQPLYVTCDPLGNRVAK